MFLGEEDGEGDRERNDRDLVEAACFEGVESAWDDGQAGAVVVDVVVVVVVVDNTHTLVDHHDVLKSKCLDFLLLSTRTICLICLLCLVH